LIRGRPQSRKQMWNWYPLHFSPALPNIRTTQVDLEACFGGFKAFFRNATCRTLRGSITPRLSFWWTIRLHWQLEPMCFRSSQMNHLSPRFNLGVISSNAFRNSANWSSAPAENHRFLPCSFGALWRLKLTVIAETPRKALSSE
jgi:hypothetical protein